MLGLIALAISGLLVVAHACVAGARGARGVMMARRDRLLLAALVAWVLTPIAVLIVRAIAQSWRFPQILPDATDAVAGAARPPQAAV